MKLEHRLALLTACITAGTMATCLAMAFLFVRRSANLELDEMVMDGAKAAAVVVSHLEDEAERAASLRELLIPDDVALIVRRLALYSSSGQRIAASPESKEIPKQLDELLKLSRSTVNQPFDVKLPEGPMRAVLLSSPTLNGMTLLHAVSRAQVIAIVESRARLFVSLFLVALSLVVFASRWLGRRLAADVNHVTAVARRVASGELTARAGTTGLTSPETQNLARELDNMIAELAALMASQRSFISNAAHELRSPLAALQGELQLALRRPRTEEVYVEMLGNALTEVSYLTWLTEDLLILARAQADMNSLEASRIEDIVDDALRLVQGAVQIQETSVCVNIDSIANDIVTGRRRDLSRLLRNLLENAVKFGPRGGRVRLGGSHTGSHIVIFVEDHGPGISRKDQADLFEPFFRGSSKTAGTGLGLAISKEIAKKSGGDIVFDDAYGPGARFLVHLQVATKGKSVG